MRLFRLKALLVEQVRGVKRWRRHLVPIDLPVTDREETILRNVQTDRVVLVEPQDETAQASAEPAMGDDDRIAVD